MVPEAVITTLEPDSLIVTNPVVPAVGVGVGVLVAGTGVEVGSGVGVGVLVAATVGVAVGVGVGVAVGGTGVGVGVGVEPPLPNVIDIGVPNTNGDADVTVCVHACADNTKNPDGSIKKDGPATPTYVTVLPPCVIDIVPPLFTKLVNCVL
jgi:hypothetical protein